MFNQHSSPDQGHIPFSKLDMCVRKSKLRVTKSHRTKQGVNLSSHTCLSCSKPVFFPLCRAGSNTASVLWVTFSALMSCLKGQHRACLMALGTRTKAMVQPPVPSRRSHPSVLMRSRAMVPKDPPPDPQGQWLCWVTWQRGLCR